MSDATYECPMHTILHQGQKRETFQQDYHETLINASMQIAMQLYKEVKQNCHCPINYTAFDRICAEQQKDPKHSAS
jgi:hypothetical protein